MFLEIMKEKIQTHINVYEIIILIVIAGDSNASRLSPHQRNSQTNNSKVRSKLKRL